jgi:hypothetical protein
MTMPAAFGCPLGEFANTTDLEKLGRLIAAAAETRFATHFTKQTEAWQQELKIIRETAAALIGKLPRSASWWVFFEYEIPRRGKRPDVVLIADDLIFIIDSRLAQRRLTRHRFGKL